MTHRLFSTLVLTLLTSSLACQQSGIQAPTIAASPVQTLQVDRVTGGSAPLGIFDARIDTNDGELTFDLTPIASQERAGQDIGDLLVLEIVDYLKGATCADCFGISGISQNPGGDVQLDLRMRHPFRTTEQRADLDLFDPRVIILADQLITTYPGLGPIFGGIDGLTLQSVQLEPGLIPNADGHTARYDWMAESPLLVGTPRNYAGTINPYIDFFTENDPDPIALGTPIAGRRMSMASADDVKRIVISKDALAARGNQMGLMLIIETSYAQAGRRNIPAGQRGSRLNPVYFLPASNRKEAMLLAADPVPAWPPNSAGLIQSVEVDISDWQASKVGVGDTNYAVAPDYLGVNDIPFTSTLTTLQFSLPALDPTVKTITAFPAGDGTLSLPWTASIAVGNVNNPPAGTYYGLLAAIDSYHGTQALPGFAYGSEQSYVRDFQTFKVVPVDVEASTGDDPPIAQLKARKQGNPTWTDAPGNLTVFVGDVVEFTLADSTDDLNSWATPAAHYDLDGNAVSGANGGFETTDATIGGIVTTTYPSATTINIRGKVRDAALQFSVPEALTLTIDPAPNAVPVAQLKGRKQGDVVWVDAPGVLNVTAGDTVEFSLTDSTDDLTLWANPAAHYDLDGNALTGANGGFEVTRPLIATVVTSSYPTATSLTIRGMVRDASNQFAIPESLTLNVAAAPNNPPVAILKARKQGTVPWTSAPGPLSISTGDTVEYTLMDSTDDLSLWSNPAAYYDIDGNIVNGFETTGTLISTIVSRLYSSPATITASAKVRDNAPQDSAVVTMTINVAGAVPTCYSVTAIADFPIRVYEHSADTIGGKIYIAGGWSLDFPGNKRVNQVYEYDPALNTYALMPGTFLGFETGQGRSGMDAIALNNRLYLMGGEGHYNGSCTFRYNPTSWYDTVSVGFTEGVNLNPSLWRAEGVAWNNRIWMPGGFREWDETSCGSFVNSVNTTTVYNPSTNTYSNLNDFGSAILPFTTRRWAHGAAVLNNKLYVLPGQGETITGAQGYTSTVEELDLTSAGASWIAKDSIPSHRWLYEVAVLNNRAYIIGGLNQSSGGQSTVYQFDPTRPPGTQWTTLTTACGGTPLPGIIYGHATAVYNNEIYCFAGTQTLSNPIRTSYKITIQ